MGGKPTADVMPTGVSLHGKTLRITFQYKGRRCRESLGLEPTKTNIKYAAGKLAAIKYEIKTSIFSYISHFPTSQNALKFEARSRRVGFRIGELCEEFKLLKFAELKISTISRYRSALNLCVGILGSERLISALYPEDIRRVRVELMNTRAPNTCNHYMVTLRELLVFAEENGYTDKKLSAELRVFKLSSKDPDPFTVDEVQRALDSCVNPVHRNMFQLMVYTGLRPGELVAIAWEDVDFERRELTVNRALSEGGLKLPKTDKSRVVVLSPPAIEALKQQQQYTFMKKQIVVDVLIGIKATRTEHITPVFSPAVGGFKNQETFWIPETLRQAWVGVLKRGGLRYRTLYQLRHTYACWNLTAHGNVAFIAKQMGHADYTMLVKVYGRWMDGESHTESDRIWESLKNMGHG